MKRKFKKQTRDDFLTRLDRLDPAYVRSPRKTAESWEVEKTAKMSSKTGPGPLKYGFKAFGVALIALYAASHPGAVQKAIANVGVPYELRFAALALVAALLTSLVVLLANHAARACIKKIPNSDRSMGIASGALLGIMAFHLPPEIWQAGYENTTAVVQAALSGHTGIAPIDWGTSILVSSLPK